MITMITITEELEEVTIITIITITKITITATVTRDGRTTITTIHLFIKMMTILLQINFSITMVDSQGLAEERNLCHQQRVVTINAMVGSLAVFILEDQ
jgi:hypothetical protein